MAVADFPDLRGATTDLGRYAAERLTTHLASVTHKFRLTERRRLQQVVGELSLSQGDLIDPRHARQVGEMLGVDAIVVGTISVLADRVEIDARIVEIETNTVVSQAAVSISRDAVVDGLLSGATAPSGQTGSPARQGRIDSLRPTGLPSAPGAAAAPAPGESCAPTQVSRNRWLSMRLNGCASLSPDGGSISFTLSVENVSSGETLHVGAQCCDAGWLVVTDNLGASWTGTMATVTRLPTQVDRNLVELAPGTGLTVTAVVSNVNRRTGSAARPTSVSITASLLRRTAAEQQRADAERYSNWINMGQPVVLGVSGARLRVAP